MGFYDRRCSVSGVSLKGQRCHLVLLRQRGDRFEPIWSPVGGPYNRLGSIDVRPDVAVEVGLLRQAVRRLHAEGRLVSHWGPLQDTEPFFELFEPNRNRVTLDGDPIQLTLIHHRISNGVFDEMTPMEELESLSGVEPSVLYRRAFEGLEPLAPYSEELGATLSFRGGARQLIKLREWHERHQPWRVPSEAGQHSEEDVARFVAEARARLAPWPLAATSVEHAASMDFFLE